ncbi:MAG TPA: CobD/CbiB family protein [Burkholderiaceae bacterium]|nr:CobD/CbiB family protein [Burkholderiaceae bacterium]
MSWIALVLTLLLEQARPMPSGNPVYMAVWSLAETAERNLNAGRRRHGLYAWVAFVLGCALVAGLVHALLLSFAWIAALIFNVVVLYFTLGFRQFSHHVTEIQAALNSGDLVAARRQLTEWKRSRDPTFDASEMEAPELIRQAIEHGLVLSHRHVFGVLFWFVLLPGPVGAILYRLAEYVSRAWNRPTPEGLPPDRFGDFARRAFAWIDWLPARLTALGFAIVGDFEGTIYCWRRVSRAPAEEGPGGPDTRTLVLAAASGALGTRVMNWTEAARYLDEAGNEGAGLAEPSMATLRSVVGLVWRTLVLWLALLLLLTLVAWFG